MPLARRKVYKLDIVNMPVSYRVHQTGRMYDARNIFSNQNTVETRHGTSRWNSTAIEANDVDSVTFFENNAGTQHVIAKVNTSLYKVPSTGASTAIKTGLTDGQKHRAVTFNGRHLIAAGSDGLYSYDGTTFTQLGQSPPSAPTAGVSGSGNSITAGTYQVATTHYDSTNGFETNIGVASSTVTITGTGEQIDVSGIDTSAANANVDKNRIYLKDVGNEGAWLFVAEQNLGVATYTITTDPTSTSTPPTKNAAPLSGGAKYPVMFGKKLVYSGNTTFPSDVFFSEEYIPDAFDDTTTRTVIKASGNGPVTGLGVGFFNDSNLNPYLCIFKKNSIEVYSEIGGNPFVTQISNEVGCISHDTIQVIKGDLYFMSSKGFHRIRNGELVKNKNGDAYDIANGDINDIFTKNGYIYEVNKSQFSNFFSVYYPTLNHYMTFVSEGSNTAIDKCYNYELDIAGFRPYVFPQQFYGACVGEDGSGENIVLFAAKDGYIIQHSVKESESDVLQSGSTQAIDDFFLLYWVAGDDQDATYNYGELAGRGLVSDTDITVKAFLNYSMQLPSEYAFDRNDSETGFILDISKLDEGIFTDGRTISKFRAGIYKTASSLLLGFYLGVENKNMRLIELQLDVSKNGNRNV